MSRYIDIEPYEGYVLQRYYRNSMGECVETVPLYGLPIADVSELRHGRWEHDGYDFPHGNDWVHCSVCGKRGINVPADLTPYCPNCGAKMDEVEE